MHCRAVDVVGADEVDLTLVGYRNADAVPSCVCRFMPELLSSIPMTTTLRAFFWKLEEFGLLSPPHDLAN